MIFTSIWNWISSIFCPKKADILSEKNCSSKNEIKNSSPLVEDMDLSSYPKEEIVFYFVAEKPK